MNTLGLFKIQTDAINYLENKCNDSMQFINLNHKRFNFGILSTELKHFFVGQCFSGENNIRELLWKN